MKIRITSDGTRGDLLDNAAISKYWQSVAPVIDRQILMLYGKYEQLHQPVGDGRNLG